MSYPNGAIIPTEGADILAVRANLQTDHDGIVSSLATKEAVNLKGAAEATPAEYPTAPTTANYHCPSYLLE